MNQSILNLPQQEIRKGSDLSTLHYIFAYFILLAAIILAYFPALDNNFIFWDDQYYVTQNIYISKPTFSHLKVLLTKAISLNYHPITMLSLWSNSYFFGIESATPFIVTNLVIHSVASIALFHLLASLIRSHIWLSIFISLVFAIHPVHIESVIWVSERKDVLYALFFFLSLHQYIKYIDSNRWTHYIFAIVLFIFSCLSKGMAVSLVPVLFLIDFYKKKSSISIKGILQKSPFIVFGIIFGLLTVNIQGGGNFFGLISNTSLENALLDENNFSILERLNHIGYSLFYYLSSFFYWSGISAFHPYLTDINWFYSTIPPVFLGCLIYTLSYKKNLFFGLSFFFVTILLVLPYNQLGSAVMADRYTYLPHIGIAFLVGIVLERLFTHNLKIIYSMIFIFISLCIITTHSYSDLWQNHTILFKNVVEKYPNDARSRTILASGYWKDGKIEKAIEEQEIAINELGLYTSEGFENLATFYSDIGDKKKALAFYNHSIALNTDNFVARYHRALLLMATHPQKAIEDFNSCEKLGDAYITPLIYSPRGNCYGRLQKYAEAIEDFSKAIELNQDLIISYEDRALTYQAIGENELANKDLEKVKILKTKTLGNNTDKIY